MDSAYRTAAVFVRERYAGRLSENESGYAFEYDEGYLASGNALAVSLTMPLRKEAYQSAVLFPFFDGLIPEGWLLGVATRNWKADLKDRFGLLLLVCRDCIGDVSVRREAE